MPTPAKAKRFETHSLKFTSNEDQHRITVNSPQFGNWFAVAFISWTNPKDDLIEQQGLATSCNSLLLSEMSIIQFQPIIIYDSVIQINTLRLCHDPFKCIMKNRLQRKASKWNLNERNEFIYKFYVSRKIEAATAFVSITEACQECPNMAFQIKSNALPNITNESHQYKENSREYNRHIIKPNRTQEITIDFFLQPESWHYLHVVFVNKTKLETNTKRKRGQKLIFKKLPQFSENERLLNNSKKNSLCPQVKFSLQIIFQKPKEAFYEESEKQYADLFLSTNKSVVKFWGAALDDNITLEHTCTNFSVNESRLNIFRGINFYPILRQTYGDFFTFDYDLMPDNNGDIPKVINLNGGIPLGFTIHIDDLFDIGGTLTFTLSMIEANNARVISENVISNSNNTSIEGNKYEREKKNEKLSRKGHTIIVCLHIAEPGVPNWPDKCRYGQRIFPASIIINNTDIHTSSGLIHIPFPESGQWHITMALFCHGAETIAHITTIESIKQFLKENINILYNVSRSCTCFLEASRYINCVKNANCLISMNETETLKIKECLIASECTPKYLDMVHRLETHNLGSEHLPLENCSSSAVFTISSSSCIAGHCGRFGHCHHYMSGGCVFSTCVCRKGYRGWDCSEDSQVSSSSFILVASLLLMFSNLLFLPGIYMAVRRGYYSEAIIYCFATLFSVLYHACDSGEDNHSFCLVKFNVLQFCDFYCGVLSIWVTLIAMSHIRQEFVSLLHMFGAIALAFGTELNKQSLWIFLAPALTGICLISTSWIIQCYKLRKCYPAPKYLTIYMPLGIFLVMTGLICYAFLQTNENYYIVHSVWHMIMALSILCLLPSRKFFMIT